MCPVFTEDMALFVNLRVPILRDKLFGTCHRLESKMVSIDKPIPSSVSRGHDAVQRETRRQRVKRHMRVHTVVEPSNIQQKSSSNKFSTLCGLCDECWFQRSLLSAVGCPCTHQEAIMSECGQAYPEDIANCERSNRVKTMGHRP